MKYILITLVSLLFTACSPVESSKTISGEAFDELCVKYDMHMCGDFEPVPYQNPTIEEIKEYAEKLFQGSYIYTKDVELEDYDYMTGDPMRGDCDDVVVTLFEDLLSIGYLDNGQAKWVFGTVNDIYHAWLLITLEGETYIFDTFHLYGAKYNEVPETYKKEFLVYRY